MMFMRVDFPAPLGPMMAVSSPDCLELPAHSLHHNNINLTQKSKKGHIVFTTLKGHCHRKSRDRVSSKKKHVSGPVGRTGGPKKKSFQGGTFETGGFNICPTSKNVNTPFKDIVLNTFKPLHTIALLFPTVIWILSISVGREEKNKLREILTP